MNSRIEVDDYNPIVSLEDLWLSSSDTPPKDWRIPPHIKIGVASHSEAKVAKVRAVLRQHGSQLTASANSSEEEIQALLRSGWNKKWQPNFVEDTFRVPKIAAQKCLRAFRDNSTITYAIALDTDVVVLGDNRDLSREPLGRPTNVMELLAMLAKISGRMIEVHTGAAFADVKTRVILAIEEVQILLKLKRFNMGEYLDKFGFDLSSQVPGAIDYSSPGGRSFLNPSFKLTVMRNSVFYPRDSFNLALVEPAEADKVLGDYFQGCPPLMINSVLYHGLNPPKYMPFPNQASLFE